MQNPHKVACWRFDQISPLLNECLTRTERRRFINEMAQNSVPWPSGSMKPIKKATLYRWMRLYKNNPVIESLYPKNRSSSNQNKCIKSQWVDYALTLLEEDPDRSLYMISHFIKNHFSLNKLSSLSSLHRALCKHPKYIKLRKRKTTGRRFRVRFEATEPHLIWHADAKGEFDCHFSDGSTRKMKILTIIDDATRYVLGSRIVKSETSSEAVATFRQAAGRYGLPHQFYADLGSAYDSHCFRSGLATLGVHRINTKPRNPSAHGKIEAWHRVLKSWFVRELKHQLLGSVNHLQELLDAFISELYHTHIHKELKKSTAEAFNQKISDRHASFERLWEAFLIRKTVTTEKKTGNIREKGRLYKVPEDFISLSRKVDIVIDPEEMDKPLLVLKQGKYKYLDPAVIRVSKKESQAVSNEEEPIGSLTPLLDKYRNRGLPQAVAGFGLPEIYQLFSDALKREVPHTETEATLLLNWLKEKGPFEPKSLRAAVLKVVDRWGSGRPMSQLIGELNRKMKTKEGK